MPPLTSTSLKHPTPAFSFPTTDVAGAEIARAGREIEIEIGTGIGVETVGKGGEGAREGVATSHCLVLSARAKAAADRGVGLRGEGAASNRASLPRLAKILHRLTRCLRRLGYVCMPVCACVCLCVDDWISCVCVVAWVVIYFAFSGARRRRIADDLQSDESHRAASRPCPEDEGLCVCLCVVRDCRKAPHMTRPVKNSLPILRPLAAPLSISAWVRCR